MGLGMRLVYAVFNYLFMQKMSTAISGGTHVKNARPY